MEGVDAADAAIVAVDDEDASGADADMTRDNRECDTFRVGQVMKRTRCDGWWLGRWMRRRYYIAQ